ncbi:hypothetical protein CDAR_598341 [Caerostris darwini]|uniref:Uncharacterized protein n=1 Tax=Caerostris darwini TaxID=1538125 RepID=A0AAV4QKC1_9ARAC|nr:hypothetical protein CDAR_598341 [Caerostris darwini]
MFHSIQYSSCNIVLLNLPNSLWRSKSQMKNVLFLMTHFRHSFNERNSDDRGVSKNPSSVACVVNILEPYSGQNSLHTVLQLDGHLASARWTCLTGDCSDRQLVLGQETEKTF